VLDFFWEYAWKKNVPESDVLSFILLLFFYLGVFSIYGSRVENNVIVFDSFFGSKVLYACIAKKYRLTMGDGTDTIAYK